MSHRPRKYFSDSTESGRGTVDGSRGLSIRPIAFPPREVIQGERHRTFVGEHPGWCGFRRACLAPREFRLKPPRPGRNDRPSPLSFRVAAAQGFRIEVLPCRSRSPRRSPHDDVGPVAQAPPLTQPLRPRRFFTAVRSDRHRFTEGRFRLPRTGARCTARIVNARAAG